MNTKIFNSKKGKKGIATWMIVIGAILGVMLLVVIWYISTYNSLIKLNEEVNNKWAQVETQYQRRVDLIPNLVSTVKGAANFEQDTLTEITKLRSQWQTAPNVNAKVETANQIESTLSKLLVVAENYPQLTATQNFRDLQAELANTENKVAVERGRFNEAIRNFNARIKTFPSNIVASRLGYTDRTYFESAAGAENAPNVSFE
ncbi:MAG TPA: LemA family protein [Candidatus Nanoarchaeia archaeon]|nr:LemA family protein [Candidatus Nanoarchaeia archaeon]